MKKINALSLFDGMGCLGIALKDLGVEFNYFTSEIDKHAIAQSKLNFPDSTQLGDVTKWKEWGIDWSKIDIIGSGSPCQGFSFAGKQLAFDDPRSALFFVFVEILEHTKKLNPNVIFLLENVKMKKEHELVITKYMGVAPIEINAALVSAQNRRRLFWTNIKNEPYGLFGDMQCTIPQPKDRGILLKDILENDVPEKYYLSEKAISRINEYNNSERMLDNSNKSNCLAAGYSKLGRDNTYIIQLNPSKESGGKQPYQQNRVYDTNGKNPALCSGQEQWGENAILIPEATKKGYTEVNPGECFDLTLPTSETRRGRLMENKSNCLTAAKFDFMQYTQDFKIRRLTPTECARLQSIPSWYKWNCSDSQAYKMCGNGWNVEVIKHILSYALF